MQLGVNIALVVVGTVWAVVALGGDTWEKPDTARHGRLTFRGWLAVGLLVIGLMLGVVKEVRAATDKAILKGELTVANLYLSDALEGLKSVDTVLRRLEPEILNAVLSSTAKIPREADLGSVTLDGLERQDLWSPKTDAPLTVYGGEQVECILFGHGDVVDVGELGLSVVIGESVHALRQQQQSIRVVGDMDTAQPVSVLNPHLHSTGGLKVIVVSTNAIRFEYRLRELLENIEGLSSRIQDAVSEHALLG